jgi:hypothetical protein
MTAIIITPSQDPSFIRPVAALRSRGIGTVVVSLDVAAFDPAEDDEGREHQRQRARALRHALAEYELPTVGVRPHQPLAEALAR